MAGDKTGRSESSSTASASQAPVLPIVRFDTRERSFRLGRHQDGIAVFAGEIVLFTFPFLKRWLPEEAYADPHDSRALTQTPGVRVRHRVPLSEVESLAARLVGPVVRIELVANARHRRIELPAGQYLSLHSHFGATLGSKYDAPFTADELPAAAKKVSSADFGAAVLLTLLGLAGIVGGVYLGGTDKKDRFSWYISTALAVPGTLVAIAGAVSLTRTIQRRRRMIGVARQPLRSWPAGVALRLLGVIIFLAGYFSVQSVLLVRQWLGLSFDPEASQEIGGTLGSILPWVGAILVYIGYRLSLPGAQPPRRGQPPGTTAAAPAVFLRSFTDDNLRSMNPKSTIASLLGVNPIGWIAKLFGPVANLYPWRVVKLALGRASDTAEEQLARFFRRLGPFVAIGRPGERMATGGAQRMYVDNDAWQQAVVQLLDQSWAVVIQPAATAGVWWEIEQTLRTVPPHKVVMCLVNFRDDPEGYDGFCTRMSTLLGRRMPRSLGDGMFARFEDDWTPVYLPAAYRTELTWPVADGAVDVHRSLAPFLAGVRVDRFGRTPRPRVIPRWLAVVGAMGLWIALPVYGVMIGSQYLATRAQALAAVSPKLKAITGDQPPLVWQLPDNWHEQTFHDRSYAAPGRIAVATLFAWDAYDQPDVQRTERNVEDRLSQTGRLTPLGRETRTHHGRTWNRLQWTVQTSSEQLRVTADLYSGPEGDFAVVVEMAEKFASSSPSSVRILIDAATNLQIGAEALEAWQNSIPAEPLQPGDAVDQSAWRTFSASQGRYALRAPPDAMSAQLADGSVVQLLLTVAPRVQVAIQRFPKQPFHTAESLRRRLGGDPGIRSLDVSPARRVSFAGRSWSAVDCTIHQADGAVNNLTFYETIDRDHLIAIITTCPSRQRREYDSVLRWIVSSYSEGQ